METKAGRLDLGTTLYRTQRISDLVRERMTSAGRSLMLRLRHPFGSASQEVVEDVDFVAAKTAQESQYFSQWTAPCPLFTPWLGHPDFQAVYEGAAPYTIVSPIRCYILISLARYASHLAGDFAECGVYKGGTALLLARVLKSRADKKLYLFDSFQGLPKSSEQTDQWFHEGQFSDASVEAVEELLREFRSMVDIRPGWIPQTFTGLEDNRYAFAHLDVDLYRSNFDCCEYFYPRLVSGGVLLFDEYGFAAARGEKDAVDEFFANKPECPIVLPTGQGIVVKLPAERNKARQPCPNSGRKATKACYDSRKGGKRAK